jgi:sugar lactone lactonase YvrE
MSIAQAGLIAALCTACGGGGGGAPVDPPRQSPPSITTQPASQSTSAGTQATFSVVASGQAPLTYQWQRNGADIAGATLPAYALALPQLSDSGSKWSVVVRNGAGSVTSAEATLTVTSAGSLQLVAGSIGGPGSIDGAGISARFESPRGVASDSAGNLYVADSGNGAIRKISSAGAVTTIAGKAGMSGSEDGTGSAARFSSPAAIARDSAGNLYVTDTGNYTVRKITQAGVVTTLAGSAGQKGAADGTGAAARFGVPIAVAVDNAGNVYVADMVDWSAPSGTIRKITPAGVVTTLAGSAGQAGSADGQGQAARFFQPHGLTVDAAGTLYVADGGNHTVRKVSSSGAVTTFAGQAGQSGSTDGAATAARFFSPQGMASDNAGNIYVGDGFETLRKISPAGVVSTLAGSGLSGSADGLGREAKFDELNGLALDGAGNVYVADAGNYAVRKVTPAGLVSTVAGTARGLVSRDGSGAAARFFAPIGLAIDTGGTLYVGDAGLGDSLRTITPAGLVSTLAGSLLSGGAIDGAGVDARFGSPHGVAVDLAGTVYVVDTFNRTIRKVTPLGVVTTLAGTAGKVGADDGLGAAASFNYPERIALDGLGNLYVSDNGAIRKITPGGMVSTLAGQVGVWGSNDGTGSEARFVAVYGLAVDAAGTVYVSDSTSGTIRKISPAGVVATLAGNRGFYGAVDGRGAAARFGAPRGLALDAAGNIYVADWLSHTIRKVTPAGMVSTVAGVAGVNGIALGALPGSLSYPDGLAIDANGVLYVSSGEAILKIQL